jgi:hypothetical protein
MPPRRARQEELDDDGFDLLASQNSSNSDDTACVGHPERSIRIYLALNALTERTSLEKALLAHYAGQLWEENI